MKYTLAFDVYGTLINTSGVYDTLEVMIGKKAEVFMNTWRNKQLEYSFRRGLMDRFTDFSVCTRQALHYSCTLFKIDLTLDQRSELMLQYSILPMFNDVEESILTLKEEGHKLFAFSNGSHKAVTGLLSHAGIIDLFDGVVSVESTQTFKPNPLVYKHFNKVTASIKSNTWLISGNSFDVMGARSYGMHAAWVQRTAGAIFDPWDIEPSVTIKSLSDLSEALAVK